MYIPENFCLFLLIFLFFSAIDAHELLKEVISKVQEVCLHLQGTLPKFKVPDRSYKVSASAIRNRRRKMEDRHIILPDINNLFALKVREEKKKHLSCKMQGNKYY